MPDKTDIRPGFCCVNACHLPACVIALSVSPIVAGSSAVRWRSRVEAMRELSVGDEAATLSIATRSITGAAPG